MGQRVGRMDYCRDMLQSLRCVLCRLMEIVSRVEVVSRAVRVT